MIRLKMNACKTLADRPEVSIVIPAFNEEGNIDKLYSELIKVLPQLNMQWEIIFADDGSSDKTWDRILGLHRMNSGVKGIRLSRNFGHQYALFAGLSRSLGRAVISMDADLQHPPELIPELVEEWRKGNKIVHTIRSDPEDFGFFKKAVARIYYKLFSFLSGVKIERGMADFRLLDRDVVDSILQFREEGLFLRGIVHWVGFKSARVNFRSLNRYSGTSQYTFKKMARLGWHGITAFSIIPLRLAVLVGIITSGVALFEIVYVIYARFITGSTVPGWASTVSILSFLLGIMFILLGLLGEYIGRILVEVRQRPRFLISDEVGSDAGHKSGIFCRRSDFEE